MSFFQKLMQVMNLKVVASSIGVLALILFSGYVLFEATKSEVVLANNGEEQVVHTHTNTIGELFAEEGLAIKKHDFLSHEQNAPIEDGMKIDYKTAKQVTVDVNGTAEVYHTTEDDIQGFFDEQNLTFTENDAVSHEPTDKIEDGTAVHVLKAFEVDVLDGGKNVTANTTGGTVENVLLANEIELNDEDEVKPALDKEVEENMEIEIVRVLKETEEVSEKVAYETETEEDSSLLKGEEEVINEGQDGEIVKKYEITKENDEEISRELIEEETTKETVNRVVAIGTKEPEQQTASSNESDVVQLASKSDNTSSPSSDGKTLTMQASAFTASCDGCSGQTATGINLNANPNQKVIAVDPNVIPLGTKVWVEGYGEAIAGDTGGAIKGNKIDVHVSNKSQAYSWGIRTVQVKILN